MDAWGSLLVTVAENHQVITMRQVDEVGMDRRTARRRFVREGWTRGPLGTWSPPGVAPDVWGRARAATLAVGDYGLVTGRTGLHLLGAHVEPEEPIRVVTPMDRHVARRLDRQHVRVIASRTLRDGDAGVRRRVPVAVAARCVMDLVHSPTPAVTPVREALASVLQKGLLGHDDLAEAVRRTRGVRGHGVLARAVHDLDIALGDSPFADRVVRRLLRDGFRPDRRPATVEVPGRDLHPDVTWAERRVCVECDGLRWHSLQRDVAVDDRKSRAYRRVGWTCLRIGWWEFDHGWQSFARDLRDALRAESPAA